jgi:DNA primase
LSLCVFLLKQTTLSQKIQKSYYTLYRYYIGSINYMLKQFIDESHLKLLNKKRRLPLAYLVSRGITLEEIKRFKIGYTGPKSKNVVAGDPDSENFNKWLGRGGYFVKNRIVFPIYDEMGEAKGIETRALDKRSMSVLSEKYKFLLEESNLAESEVRYKKFYLSQGKYSACFFGLPGALESIWDKKEIFLTEGIIDCICLFKLFPNCLSSMTANINYYQMSWLKRFATRVILLYDMDKKGQEAIAKIKKNLESDLSVFAINLKGNDVNDTLLSGGLSELKYIINSKMDRFF